MPFDDVLNLNGLLIALKSYTWWKVALELLVIGVVVFWVIRFLQDTRGARLLKGILLVLISGYIIVRILDRSFELITLGYLYSRFLLFAGAAIVVVFQPELRRALMRLGETRLFASRSNADARIDPLIEAASFCAKRKIGALIAVEREVALAGTAEGATKLDAELSSRLLNTIFWPNSPLHDLGVVISKGRIMYAGVQFPLAESGELERDLGSRHRAAVGMSQDSDALVIVVSEESGQISVAQYGKLTRKLKPDTLREMLEQALFNNDPAFDGPSGFSDETEAEPTTSSEKVKDAEKDKGDNSAKSAA